MLLPGPGLYCTGSLALWKFSQHLPAKYKVKTKKVLPNERRAPGTYGKSGRTVIALCS